MSTKSYFIFYPSPIQKEPTDPSKILSDLGRATKRGIKKCYKCGIYNGTRGLMCKNKQCDAVFKDSGEKQKLNLNAVRLMSGTSKQVFSVRVRDKGPDCRGFVQLPLMQGNDEITEKKLALSEVALCFVDSCQRLFDDSILKCHETEEHKIKSICIHIRSSLKSVDVAQPIETKNCLLSSLNFDEDVKHNLWLLSSKTDGPLVQRVSKTIMAVKCQVSPKHPLGYLHFTFYVTKGKETYDKFYCSCSNFKGPNYLNLNHNLQHLNQKCVHFYACIWAFASDFKLAKEFLDFLNLFFCVGNRCTEIESLKHQEQNSDGFSKINNNRTKKYFDIQELHKNKFKLPHVGSRITKTKKCKFSNEKSISKIPKTLNFNDWLTSVTEAINQVLSFRQNECTEVLTFHIHMSFIQLLKEKIQNTIGNDYPNASITATVTTYLIYNILQLEEIFNTPKISLRTKTYHMPNFQENLMEISQQEHLNILSYAKHSCTFLKVGKIKNEEMYTPFTIKWTTDVLPISNFVKVELIFNIGYFDPVQV